MELELVVLGLFIIFLFGIIGILELVFCLGVGDCGIILLGFMGVFGLVFCFEIGEMGIFL